MRPDDGGLEKNIELVIRLERDHVIWDKVSKMFMGLFSGLN